MKDLINILCPAAGRKAYIKALAIVLTIVAMCVAADTIGG